MLDRWISEPDSVRVRRRFYVILPFGLTMACAGMAPVIGYTPFGAS
jgi:hypothetical protein